MDIEEQMKTLSTRLDGMDEDQLRMAFPLLEMLVNQQLASGKISESRAERLRSLLKEFEAAMALPLEQRVARMREIIEELLTLGTS